MSPIKGKIKDESYKLTKLSLYADFCCLSVSIFIVELVILVSVRTLKGNILVDLQDVSLDATEGCDGEVILALVAIDKLHVHDRGLVK